MREEQYYRLIHSLRRLWEDVFTKIGGLITECERKDRRIGVLEYLVRYRQALLDPKIEIPDPEELEAIVSIDESRRDLRRLIYQFKKDVSEHGFDPRTKVILFLGARCKVCGSEEIDFLQIDHKNGDGWKDREYFKQEKIHIWNYYLTFLEEAADKLQLLCEDCHREKTIVNEDFWHRRQHGDIVN
jgi:hypothetical protein